MQKVFNDESYANSIEIYLERLKGDVWTIEATENNFKELPLFDRFKNSLKKKIAVGVISHRTLQADFRPSSPSESGAASNIPPTSLCSRPTAASADRDFNRHLAFSRPSRSRWLRNIVLKELGLPERRSSADERLA
jgi:5-methyltetrahydropteroyltriglutamate--homocysteine methyltransferase